MENRIVLAAGHLPVADKYRLREIGHSEGREEMFRVAKQMRRADARLAFITPASKRLAQLAKRSAKPKPAGYWRKVGFASKPKWWDT